MKRGRVSLEPLANENLLDPTSLSIEQDSRLDPDDQKKR